MRALAIGLALAAVLFLVTGGHFILIPLLLPLGLLSLRRKPQLPGSRPAAGRLSKHRTHAAVRG